MRSRIPKLNILAALSLLAAVLLLAPAAAGGTPGSKGDPLVSKSWVDQYVAGQANLLEQRLDKVAEQLRKTTVVKLWIGRAYLEVDGVRQPLDAPAYLAANGRTYVPLRALGEAIGARLEWDNSAKQATYIKDGRRIVLLVGRAVVQVNGQEIAADSAPEAQNGRVFVPLRVVTDNLGLKLQWDNAEKLATLTY